MDRKGSSPEISSYVWILSHVQEDDGLMLLQMFPFSVLLTDSQLPGLLPLTNPSMHLLAPSLRISAGGLSFCSPLPASQWGVMGLEPRRQFIVKMISAFSHGGGSLVIFFSGANKNFTYCIMRIY